VVVVRLPPARRAALQREPEILSAAECNHPDAARFRLECCRRRVSLSRAPDDGRLGVLIRIMRAGVPEGYAVVVDASAAS